MKPALRIYVGYAADVGKTCAMLAKGQRQRGKLGVDIVVGFVELHGHAPVLERLQGSEAVPLRRVATRAGCSPEMDLDAIVARRPRVALVDELLDAVITFPSTSCGQPASHTGPYRWVGQRRSRAGGEPP